MSVQASKWPKPFPTFTAEQEQIRHDFMEYWHTVLPQKYLALEKFNHQYAIKHRPKDFLCTLEIGAGLGEHLEHELLNEEQRKNYVALDLRENMMAVLRRRFDVNTLVADCQEKLPFKSGDFDRIIAIHVLEHLYNLPAAIREVYRVCNKAKGIFSVVIPCEGGWLYSLARKMSTERIFKKRYGQPLRWWIESEHVNRPREILDELSKCFEIAHQSYFPSYFSSVNLNLCIGLTLKPRKKPLTSVKL